MSFFLLDILDILAFIVIFNLFLLSRRVLFLAWFFRLPAIFLHELSHWIFAFLTNAKPSSLNIFPKKIGNSVVFGSVECKNITWYNALFVSMSPLILFPMVFFLKDIFFFFKLNSSLFSYIYLYLLLIFFTAAMPSSQDVKVFFSKPIAVLIVFAILISSFFLFEKEYLLCFNYFKDIIFTKFEEVYFL